MHAVPPSFAPYLPCSPTAMFAPVLLVGTSTTYHTLVRYRLAHNPSIQLEAVSSGPEALRTLDDTTALVVVDANLPDSTGLALIRQMRAGWPSVPILLLVRPDEAPDPAEAMAQGATDLLMTGRSDLDRIEWWIDQVSTRTSSTLTLPASESPLLIGDSPAMRKTLCWIERARTTDDPIFISGEAGTELERVARLIHEQSEQAGAPFIELDARTLVPDTAAETLFGTVPSEPTSNTIEGAFAQAGNGTLFLHHLDQMDPDVQALLPEVLCHHAYTPVGSDTPTFYQGRVMGAAYTDPEQAVTEGTLRSDLYHVISQCPVPIPPLRKREQDILLLAKRLLREETSETDTDALSFSVSAMRRLMQHDWPRNLKELRDTIKRGVEAASGVEIGATDLFPGQQQTTQPDASENNEKRADSIPQKEINETESPPTRSMFNMEPEPDDEPPVSASSTDANDSAPPSPLEAMQAAQSPHDIVPLSKLQEMAVAHALHVCNGDMKQVADALGVPRATVAHFSNNTVQEPPVKAD